MRINYNKLQVSQLYLSERKINNIRKWITEDNLIKSPISVRRFSNCEKLVIIDGHTRLFCALENGITNVPVLLNTGPLTSEIESLYMTCIDWCIKKSIFNVKDLQTKIVNSHDYQKLWIDRCQNELKTVNRYFC